MGFDGELKFDTRIDKTGFKIGIDSLGSIAKAGMAAVTGAVAAATGAVAGLGFQALTAYGDFEQLVGGVETLFKNAAGTVQNYASEAFRTAGMSANTYMETVTSFSAALLQGLGGDTAAAAEIANVAITDMADNANKMGTDISMIQNAYQGFAKQNYTMLDNLKLGYGGTQAEMARLVNESGVLGDSIEVTAETVKNVPFDKIIEAIHVVQTEMGISGISAEEAAALVASGAMTQEEAFELMGTTAKEAAGTIQGSLSMVSASWTNLMTGLGNEDADLGGLTTEFAESLMTAAGNIIPAAETILQSMTEVVTDSAPALANAAIGLINDTLPDMITAGTGLTTALVDGIVQNTDAIAESASVVITQLAVCLFDLAPDVASAGISLATALVQGIAESSPELAAAAAEGVVQICTTITENLPLVVGAGLTILNAVADSLSDPALVQAAIGVIEVIVQTILDNLSPVVSAAIRIIKSLCDTLLTSENIDKLFDAAYEILTTICSTITDNLDDLVEVAVSLIDFLAQEIARNPENVLKIVETAVEVVMTLVDALIDHSDDLLDAAEEIIIALVENATNPDNIQKVIELGTTLLATLIEGLLDLGGKLAGFSFRLFEELSNSLAEIDWGDLGISIVEGICSGLLGCDFVLTDYMNDFGENWLSGLQMLFDIHSPSRLMKRAIGKPLALGIGEGFSETMPDVGKDALAAFRPLQTSVSKGAVEAFTSLSTAGTAPVLQPSATSQISNSYSSHDVTTTTSIKNEYHIHTQAASAADARELAEELAFISEQNDSGKGL